MAATNNTTARTFNRDMLATTVLGLLGNDVLRFFLALEFDGRRAVATLCGKRYEGELRVAGDEVIFEGPEAGTHALFSPLYNNYTLMAMDELVVF